MGLSTFAINGQVDAATTHTVKSGESFWVISKNYGVTVNSLMRLNGRTSSMLYVGERLQIPNSVSAWERDLLARLVHAEAKGEPYAGKVAVATVVLNRVDSSLFPDTISGVINEKAYGYYAFSPVQNGTIKSAADTEAKHAVSEALAFRGQGSGSLYFYNPRTAQSDWIKSRQATVTIGNHVFAK
ncbi:cell wall hydrolase [Bacillaceae bacterium S4-13-58]